MKVDGWGRCNQRSWIAYAEKSVFPVKPPASLPPKKKCVKASKETYCSLNYFPLSHYYGRTDLKVPRQIAESKQMLWQYSFIRELNLFTEGHKQASKTIFTAWGSDPHPLPTAALGLSHFGKSCFKKGLRLNLWGSSEADVGRTEASAGEGSTPGLRGTSQRVRNAGGKVTALPSPRPLLRTVVSCPSC